MLRRRAAEQPNDPAYIFLPDRGAEPLSLSFAELYASARTVAMRLVERGQKGDRAVLLFSPGLDFIVAFFACLLAGVIAVPMMVPRRASSRDASAAILADCSPRFAMTRCDLLTGARPDLKDRFRTAPLDWVFVDSRIAACGEPQNLLPVPGRDDIALLQYTSGSTSAPKGVVVSHGNLIENSEMIRNVFGNTRKSTHVSWVPLYHDMGLILNVLQSFYVGALCVLLAPVSFMQRPLSWLRAIHDYRAEVAGGPNFAFDLCVRRHRPEAIQGIDLSCWKVAFNGAEPVRANTIDRFASTFAPYGFDAKSIQPAYGMAEATLLISADRRGGGPVTRRISRDALQRNQIVAPRSAQDAQILVGCGRQLVGERLAIVDPEARMPLGPGLVGEVWVAGPHVSQGYWHNPEATASVFRVRTASGGAQCWLRTGDLGFLDEDGELYITGRIKDLIIIRGINHYPQDIEETVQDCHAALRSHSGAAFCVPDQNDEEQLIVVQEVERTFRRQIATEEIIASIREAIVREHEVAAREIVLIHTGSLPKTTSGKIQRHLTRQMFLAGSLSLA
ncbi:MAG TPA: fatty acyl-AMP ligase [Stellaceae bacterium]|nr:fatty acyl-AMP ligase [Stellaceae bacterium]